MEEITDGYLLWKNGQVPPQTPTSQPTVEFDITIIDMYTLSSTLHVTLFDNEKTIPHLVARGYLPTSPVRPETAISLRTLEFYKLLRQRKASFGVESFTKVLCDLYGVSGFNIALGTLR